ncbi:MAG TPA: ABC transporter substrate-binding protein, partial [candidate division Zixibacteria bacterium]
MKRDCKIYWLLSLGLIFWMLFSCAKKEDVVILGEFGSLTGVTATFGKSTQRGIQMAVEEINKSGGINGKLVRVIVEDDQSKPEEAATVVKKLVNQDKVLIVLGEVASSRTLAGAPSCQEAGVPLITPASTNPKVTEVGDYVFRVCFIDPFQGEVMAKFARNTLKVSKAAILKDIKNDYSVGLAQFFTETFKSLGGIIVAKESYSEGDIEFRAQLTAIKARNPEVIFIPGYYTEVGLIARQARDLGITVPLIGGDGWDSPRLVEIGGKALENTYYSNHY